MKQYLLVLALLLSWTQPTQAQDAETPPWYRVDLLIFAQPGDHLNDEAWDISVLPSISPNAIDLNSESQNLVIMDASNKVNLPVSTSLMSRQGYEILYRKSWNQMMLPKEQTQPIRINAGELISSGFHRLDGEISIDISRYLHFRTELFYSIPVSAEWLALQTPLIDERTEDSHFLDTAEPLGEQPIVSDLLNTESAQPQQSGYLTVKMEQSRRMRRDELHYIDHPYFGIVVKMTRLDLNASEQPDKPIDAATAESNQP